MDRHLDFGTITNFNIDRGFGFVSRTLNNGARSDCFVHVSKISRRYPQIADAIEKGCTAKVDFWYEVKADSKAGLSVSDIWLSPDDMTQVTAEDFANHLIGLGYRDPFIFSEEIVKAFVCFPKSREVLERELVNPTRHTNFARTFWWGHHSAHGLVLLDRTIKCNAPGLNKSLLFVRCSDKVVYEEPRDQWRLSSAKNRANPYKNADASLDAELRADADLYRRLVRDAFDRKCLLENAQQQERERQEQIDNARKLLEQEERERRKRIEDERLRKKQQEIARIESERRRRLQPLSNGLRLLTLSSDDALRRTLIVCPSLEGKDIALCYAWSGIPFATPIENLSIQTLAEAIGDREACRLLSARIAELSVASYYRFLGRNVVDVSIAQIEGADNRWKDFDLLVDGKPIDVKNARRSFSNPESFVSHCVPRFKSSRDTADDVTVVGVLSDYLVIDDYAKGGMTVRILGEVDVTHVRNLYRWMRVRFGSWLDLHALWKTGYQPGWVFEYPTDHYVDRSQAIDTVRNAIDSEQYSLSDIPDWVLPLVFHESRLVKDPLAHEKRAILADLNSLRLAIGLSRPNLFVFSMGLLLEGMRNGYKSELITDQLRALMFLCDKPIYPLGLVDSQNYISQLIDMMTTIYQSIVGRGKKLDAFRMPHPLILKGRTDDGTWLTLVAYCGGWRTRPVRAPCGNAPLYLGQSETCPSCARLICAECGYCLGTCDLVGERQQNVAESYPEAHEMRSRVHNYSGVKAKRWS